MAILTARELAVIDKIKKLAKSALGRDELIHGVFGLLKTTIPFNSGVFFDVNPITLEFGDAHLDNLGTDFLPLYFQKFYKTEEDVLGVSQFLKKEYISKRGGELIDLKQYIRSPLYNELLSKFNCHFFLANCFTVNQECYGYLILWRTQVERDFSKKHPEMMRIVAPYIAQALKDLQPRKTTVANQAISEEEKLKEIINRRSPPGVIILDPANKVLYKNEQAQTVLYLLSKTWMQSNTPENEQPGSVPIEILNLCDRLRSTSGSDIEHTEQIACSVSTLSLGSEIFSLRALLLDNNTASNNSPPIVVLIENSSPSQRFDIEKARDRYQLTFKEKEVVQLLFQGFTNKEVAKELCIGAYTLKDHLKNIRQKMGVYTRTGILSKVVQF